MNDYKLSNGKTLCIRKVNERDAVEIVDMSIQLGGESDNLTYSESDFYFTVEQQRRFISGIMQRENCIYIVGTVDSKIIGTLSFIGGSRERISHRGDMGIGVLKDYWGIGVGTALMEYFLKWAAECEYIKKIDLQVREDNTKAINLYAKYGFKIEGRISMGMCVDGKYYDLYCMGKIIG